MSAFKFKSFAYAALAMLGLGLLIVSPVTPAAQTAGPVVAAGARDLISTPVDSSKRFALVGHRAAWAATQHDRGPIASDQQLQNLTLTLNRTPEREQAFQQLLKDQQNPSSPSYHHWLTPVELGEQFGASQHDIDALSAWLRSQGLHVDAVSNSRTRITFGGSAAAIGTAFATQLHQFQVGADTRIANTGDPKIPAAFAQIVQSINGLYTVRHKPQRHSQQKQASTIHPADTYCPDGGTCSYTIFPADFAQIYDSGSVSNPGQGQTVAVVSRARVYAADVTNFQKMAGLPQNNPIQLVVPPNGTDPGAPATSCTTTPTDTCDNPSDAVNDQGEATLDVELFNSVAPKATIKLIASSDTGGTDGIDIGINYAIDTNPVPANILSISFASCESDNGSAVTQGVDQEFQNAAVEGISVFVASGDGGVAGCEPLDSTPSNTQGVSINALCASGSVTCVGGTEFGDAADPSAYWAASDSANFLSALGYIPEGAWNDPLNDSNATQFSATGGGVSLYIATPSWQTGTGVPGTQGRYTPDVSFPASVREGYFTCFAAQNGSCVVSGGSFGFIAAGGTSASTPSMAGVAALLNQKIGSAQGNLNPRLYGLAASPSNGVFHDVTVASSGISDCALSTPSLCNNSTPGPTSITDGLQGFQVGAGYDLATGWGSIDIGNLLAQWNVTQSTFNLDQHGLAGAWIDATKPAGGQGFLIDSFPDLRGSGHGFLAMGWYTFDVAAPGGQRWYTVTGDALSNSATIVLSIYSATGGSFDTNVIATNAQVGSGNLSFSDCTHGSLDYQFDDGRSGTIALTRLDPNITCGTSGDNGSAATSFLLSGAWADSSTNSQGFFIDVNPAITNFFAAWYTYTPNAIANATGQLWYTVQSSFPTGTTSLSSVPIYATTGGSFDTNNAVTTTQVGTADITNITCTSMTLTYNFAVGTNANAGKHGTMNLTRVVTAPAGCNF